MPYASEAQTPFEDAIKQLSSENVKGYIQPFVNGFGANLNSGLSHTAVIGSNGVFVEFRAVAMGMLIGDAEKSYKALPPAPFPQLETETATVFGDIGTVVAGPLPGIDYHFQNGEVRANILPFAVPQLTIGNVLGTQAVIRYAPIPQLNDFPRITLLGGGLRHSVSQYIPGLPVDIVANAFYQQFTVGDIFDARGFSYGGMMSTSFSVLTIYTGVQLERSTMTLDYTFQGEYVPATKVHLDLEGENRVRATAGFGLNLGGFLLNADIGLGKVRTVSSGIGFSI